MSSFSKFKNLIWEIYNLNHVHLSVSLYVKLRLKSHKYITLITQMYV